MAKAKESARRDHGGDLGEEVDQAEKDAKSKRCKIEPQQKLEPLMLAPSRPQAWRNRQQAQLRVHSNLAFLPTGWVEFYLIAHRRFVRQSFVADFD